MCGQRGFFSIGLHYLSTHSGTILCLHCVGIRGWMEWRGLVLIWGETLEWHVVHFHLVKKGVDYFTGCLCVQEGLLNGRLLSKGLEYRVTANLETALMNRDLKGQNTFSLFPWWYETLHIILVLLVQNLTFLLKPTDNRAVKDFILNLKSKPKCTFVSTIFLQNKTFSEIWFFTFHGDIIYPAHTINQVPFICIGIPERDKCHHSFRRYY